MSTIIVKLNTKKKKKQKSNFKYFLNQFEWKGQKKPETQIRINY